MKKHRSALERAMDFAEKTAADPHRHAAPLTPEGRSRFGHNAIEEIQKVFPDIVDRVLEEGGGTGPANIPGEHIDLDPADEEEDGYSDALFGRVEVEPDGADPLATRGIGEAEDGLLDQADDEDAESCEEDKDDEDDGFDPDDLVSTPVTPPSTPGSDPPDDDDANLRALLDMK